MAVSGVYLVLKISEETIAETVSVKLRAKAKAIPALSQDTGLHPKYISGKRRLIASGNFLYAKDQQNWDSLFGYLKDQTEVDVEYYIEDNRILAGRGHLRRLSISGGDKKNFITGRYKLLFDDVDVGWIATEDGVFITTEDGKIIKVG